MTLNGRVRHCRTSLVVLLVLALGVTLSGIAVGAEVKVLEDFTTITEIDGDIVNAAQRWRIRSFEDPVFTQDAEVKVSEPVSLKVEGVFAENSTGTRFEIFLREEDQDLSGYERITVMLYPHKEVAASALQLRLTSGGVRTGFYPTTDRSTLPAGTWSKVTFNIPSIGDLDKTTLIELYLGRGNQPSYTFNIDTLALEKGQ